MTKVHHGKRSISIACRPFCGIARVLNATTPALFAGGHDVLACNSGRGLDQAASTAKTRCWYVQDINSETTACAHYVFSSVSRYIQTYIYTYIHTCIHTLCTCVSLYIYVYIYKRIHRTRIHMQVYTKMTWQPRQQDKHGRCGHKAFDEQ